MGQESAWDWVCSKAARKVWLQAEWTDAMRAEHLVVVWAEKTVVATVSMTGALRAVHWAAMWVDLMAVWRDAH